MTIEEIRKDLFSLQDEKYRDFHSRLIPTVPPETVIGVRTPELRKYAKQLMRQSDAIAAPKDELKHELKDGQKGALTGLNVFLRDLPHQYYDENQLHAFIVSEIKDFDRCLAEVRCFLPFVDNWATCDQLSPKVFKKHRAELLGAIREWIDADETYTIRFAVGMLMRHFLDEDFDPAYPELVAGLRSDEYYVNMMIAWYFATALAKQYETVLPYIEERRLDDWTHNKAIQKAIESYRVTDEQKAYLRTLKIPAGRVKNVRPRK